MQNLARAADAADETRDVARPTLPRITDPPALGMTAAEDRNLNPVFELLVQGESDLVGLLAYGLYKQNKRDWLIAHKARDGREPTQAETDAFILGERIPRRIATYRRLAEDMLASDVARPAEKPSLLTGLIAAPANDSLRLPSAAAKPKPTITWRYIAFLLAMLVAMAVVFRLAAGWLFGPR
jgi:hypothetical protein